MYKMKKVCLTFFVFLHLVLKRSLVDNDVGSHFRIPRGRGMAQLIFSLFIWWETVVVNSNPLCWLFTVKDLCKKNESFNKHTEFCFCYSQQCQFQLTFSVILEAIHEARFRALEERSVSSKGPTLCHRINEFWKKCANFTKAPCSPIRPWSSGVLIFAPR